MSFFRDVNLPAATAGFVAVLVGFTSSVALVFQAAQAFGATTEQITSWMWALGLGMGLCTAIPSLILPGVAAIRAAGYPMPISRIITTTGVATLVLAPFGGYALNLSAITAAICMGEEAHPDKAKRYSAAVVCGALYVVIGLVGVAVTGVLLAFPKELVAAIAGLALLGSIGGGLHAALKDDGHREAALITFLVTLSGVVIAGIGSAFWGVVAGALALFVQQYGTAKSKHP